jgi:uncharacterized protein YodC (DUF2158 family)
MQNIEPGDTVVQTSGGPHMIVESIGEQEFGMQSAWLRWTDADDHVQRKVLPVNSLKLCERTEAPTGKR